MPSSEAGGFDSIARSANELLSKINRIDFDRIGKSISGAAARGSTTRSTARSSSRPWRRSTQAMIDVQDIARKLDADARPALKRLPEIAAQLQDPLTQVNRLVGSLNTGYGDDSQFHRDLDRLMPQLTDAARSIRALDRPAVAPSRGPDQGPHQHGQGMTTMHSSAVAASPALPCRSLARPACSSPDPVSTRSRSSRARPCRPARGRAC